MAESPSYRTRWHLCEYLRVRGTRDWVRCGCIVQQHISSRASFAGSAVVKCLLIQHEGWSNCYGVDDLLCKATASFETGIGGVVARTLLLSRQNTPAPQPMFNIPVPEEVILWICYDHEIAFFPTQNPSTTLAAFPLGATVHPALNCSMR